MRLPLRGTSQAAGTAFFAGSLLLSLFCFLKILNFPLTRLGRAGPLLFCSCRKVGKRAVQRRSPVGIPLCGRAGAAFGRNSRAKRGYKIGVWRNSSPLRGWSFRADLRKASPAKAVSNVVPCAFAHDKQTFPVWRRGGKGVKLPCACLCLLSAGAESRGPRAAREVPRRGKRVEGKNENFNRRKGGKESSLVEKCLRRR